MIFSRLWIKLVKMNFFFLFESAQMILFAYGFAAACCLVASVVSDSVRPHRRQPIRLPRPWDSPSKNTGVGCHFLLQCMKVKSEREVTQSYPTLSDPMDCSPPGSSAMGFSRQEYWSGVPLAGSLGSQKVRCNFNNFTRIGLERRVLVARG